MKLPLTLTVDIEDLRQLMHYAHAGLAQKTGDNAHAAQVCTLLCRDIAHRNELNEEDIFAYFLTHHHDVHEQPQKETD